MFWYKMNSGPFHSQPSTFPAETSLLNFDIGFLTVNGRVKMKQTNLILTLGQMRGGAENGRQGTKWQNHLNGPQPMSFVASYFRS